MSKTPSRDFSLEILENTIERIINKRKICLFEKPMSATFVIIKSYLYMMSPVIKSSVNVNWVFAFIFPPNSLIYCDPDAIVSIPSSNVLKTKQKTLKSSK